MKGEGGGMVVVVGGEAGREGGREEGRKGGREGSRQGGREGGGRMGGREVKFRDPPLPDQSLDGAATFG